MWAFIYNLALGSTNIRGRPMFIYNDFPEIYYRIFKSDFQDFKITGEI